MQKNTGSSLLKPAKNEDAIVAFLESIEQKEQYHVTR
jgi:hypothetical protein